MSFKTILILVLLFSAPWAWAASENNQNSSCRRGMLKLVYSSANKELTPEQKTDLFLDKIENTQKLDYTSSLEVFRVVRGLVSEVTFEVYSHNGEISFFVLKEESLEEFANLLNLPQTKLAKPVFVLHKK